MQSCKKVKKLLNSADFCSVIEGMNTEELFEFIMLCEDIVRTSDDYVERLNVKLLLNDMWKLYCEMVDL